MKKITFLTIVLLLTIITSTVDAGTCYDIKYNAKYGTKDSSYSNNITVLQGFLREYNYLVPGPAGYFGPSTLKAVLRFQSTQGVPATGFVGPITREKIKELSCSGNFVGDTTSVNPVIPVDPYQPVINNNYGNNQISYVQNILSTHSLADGLNVIYRYKITAPDNLNLNIGTESFSLTQSGVRISNIKLQMSQNDYFSYYPTESNSVYDSYLDSTNYFSRNLQFTFSPSVYIPAGQTRYFQVVAQVSSRSSGSYLIINNPKMGSERLSSDAYSTPSSITVTSPNTNISLTKGSTYVIRWNTVQFDSSRILNINLVNDDGARYTIGTAYASNSNYGDYTWNISNDISAKGGYRIEISSGSIFDVSDTTFTILESAPSITVNTPTSSDVWNIDSTQTKSITWTYTGFDSSKNAGIYLIFPDSSSCLIGNTTIGLKSYNIALRSNSCISSSKTIIPGQYKIGVAALNNSGSYVTDISDSSFTITTNSTDPNLMKVSNPNGGEVLTATQSVYISWSTPTSVLSTDNVNIDLEVYSNTGSSPYKTINIASSIKNTKSYTWVIPANLSGSSYISSDRYKVVITAQKNTSFKDSSDNFFSINPLNRIITLTSPTATSIARDTNVTVSWNKNGFLVTDKINIAISPVGSSANTILKSNVFVSDGTYTVNIPLSTPINSYRINLIPVSYSFGTGSVSSSNIFALTNKTGYSITPNTVVSSAYKGDYVTAGWTSTGLTGTNMSIRLVTSTGSVISGVSAVSAAVSLGQKDILIPTTLATGTYKFLYEGISDGTTVTAYSNTFTVNDRLPPTITLSSPNANSTSTSIVNVSWVNNNFSTASPSITSIRVSMIQKKGSTSKTSVIESSLSPSTTSLIIPIASNGALGTLRNVGIDLAYDYQIKIEALSGSSIKASDITSGTFKIVK